MKKYLLFLFVLFCCIGCDDFHNHRSGGKGFNSFYYAVTVIDGCQYLQFPIYMGESVTHKGDCTNKIHCFNKSELDKYK